MTAKKLDRLGDILKALTSPNRLRIVLLLKQAGELNIQAIQQQLNLEQTLVSKHIAKLIVLHVVVSERRGKHVYCRLTDPTGINEMAIEQLAQRPIDPVVD